MCPPVSQDTRLASEVPGLDAVRERNPVAGVPADEESRDGRPRTAPSRPGARRSPRLYWGMARGQSVWRRNAGSPLRPEERLAGPRSTLFCELGRGKARDLGLERAAREDREGDMAGGRPCLEQAGAEDDAQDRPPLGRGHESPESVERMARPVRAGSRRTRRRRAGARSAERPRSGVPPSGPIRSLARLPAGSADTTQSNCPSPGPVRSRPLDAPAGGCAGRDRAHLGVPLDRRAGEPAPERVGQRLRARPERE